MYQLHTEKDKTGNPLLTIQQLTKTGTKYTNTKLTFQPQVIRIWGGLLV